MLFNSFAFFLFFPIVTIFYFVLPHKFRWFWLLLASCYFYMDFVPYYILILGFTIIIDYYAAILIETSKSDRARKTWLICSLIANIGVLVFFKYFNFFNENLETALNFAGVKNPIPYLSIILPIGLSFHTFQAMSYTIEVYRGNHRAERNIGIYSLYVMFYPQLVAGPIERPQNILPQFHKVQYFNYGKVVEGLKMMLWGLFKKVVIADRLAFYVNSAYQNPAGGDGYHILIATYLFAFQIYCDFSGYTDIALGAAKVMGFNLMENFRVPYLAKSVKEFWSRWHISLSTWFRDYLYIPLGGNRKGRPRWYFNLFLVFLISGFWHGANWTYIVWGALHGLYLVIGLIFSSLFKSDEGYANTTNDPYSFFKMLFTFHLVLFAWIFFRANTIEDAVTIVRILASTIFNFSFSSLSNYLFVTGGAKLLSTLVLLVMFVIMDPYMDNIIKSRKELHKRPVKYGLFAALMASLLLFGYFGEVHFIYFQF